MNLMKYFNYKYMIQNLKKSKSILALFLGIIPILSIINFFILTNTTSFEDINLEGISRIHYFGLYFIPIMISACLFGFIYKKKSVDFINSMPLSRKTIFTTNTITGIILILLMVIFSGLGIYVFSLFTNIILPFRMIVDYVLVWSIAYIFVFILSNIAASVAGNSITQIIVTMLLMFLIPFTVDYLLSSNSFIYGYNGNDICLEASDKVEKVCYYNTSIKTANYTLPYNNIHNLFMNSNGLYNIISVVKMVVLSIICFIFGKVLFVKRKMEINETSFKNLKIHNIVKALTMYPIVLIMFMIIPSDNLSFFILICCLLFLTLYFFIYDLITRRSISEVGVSIIHFIVIIVILVPICAVINNFIYKGGDKELFVTHDKIDNYKLSFDSYELSDFNYVEVIDSKSIEMITNALMERDDYKQGDSLISRKMIITINGVEYGFDTVFKTDTFNEIEKQIKYTDDIENTKTLLDNNGNYAIGFEYENIKMMSSDFKLIEEVKQVIENNISCDVSDGPYIKLYNYNNGVIKTYEIDSCTSDIISDYLDEMIQKENTRLFNEIKNLSYTHAGHKGFTYGINNYVTENMYMYDNEIYNFMKKYPSEDFTFDKEYILITGYLENKKYSYHTNNVFEFRELFNKEK